VGECVCACVHTYTCVLMSVGCVIVLCVSVHSCVGECVCERECVCECMRVCVYVLPA
jgi:hypothetical protein